MHEAVLRLPLDGLGCVLETVRHDVDVCAWSLLADS
jgi:hypothetical protein